MAKHAINAPSIKRRGDSGPQSPTCQVFGAHVVLTPAEAHTPLCDFRPGCPILLELFPENTEHVGEVLRVRPLHLAEALFRLNVTDGLEAAVHLALAIQHSRFCPLPGCTCLFSLQAEQSP